MLGHAEHQLEAVAAILDIVAQVVVEAGVGAFVLFEQPDGLVDRVGVGVPVWAGADVVQPQLHCR